MPRLRDILPPGHPCRRLTRAALNRLRLLQADLLCGPGSRRCLSFGPGGLGDDLLCSAVFHEWRRRDATPIHYLGNHPAIAKGNPNLSAWSQFNEELWSDLSNRYSGTSSRLLYAKNNWNEGRDTPPCEHIIAALCRTAGLTGKIHLRPYLYLSERERRQGVIGPKQIAIQTSGLGARFAMPTKEWFPDRFVEVAKALKVNHTIVQIGAIQDPAIPGAVDLRGRTHPRQTAAILAQSTLFIGLVGFPMHLARAMDCPAVIIYGGREEPWQSGYSCNINLSQARSCSPCWLWRDCPHSMACMREILPEQVVEAARCMLARPPGLLSVDTTVINAPEP